MVSKIIRDAMVEKGVNQVELARETGLKHETISKILRNGSRLQVLTAAKLQRALDIDDDLFMLSRSTEVDVKSVTAVAAT